MAGTEPHTRTAKYVGDIIDAVGECLGEVRACLDEALDHTDALQRSARKVAGRALRPGTSSDSDEVAELRSRVADLGARLSRYEAAGTFGAPEASGPDAGTSGEA